MPLPNKVSRKLRVALLRPQVSNLSSRFNGVDEVSGKAGLAVRLSKHKSTYGSSRFKNRGGDQNRMNPSEEASDTGLRGGFSKISHTRAMGVLKINRRLKEIEAYSDYGLLDGNSKMSKSQHARDKFKSRRSVGNKALFGKPHGSQCSNRTSLSVGRNSNRMEQSGSFRKSKFHGNSLINGPLRTADNPKIQLTEKDMNQRQRTVCSVEKPHQKMDNSVKSLPRKKKQVMRLDPHDTSNKRFVDGAVVSGCNQAKSDLKENSVVEMSKNAQFRAIQPSASILSFVEDNLLGRRRDIELRRAGYNTEISAPLDNIPFASGSERERIDVPVFRNKLEFFAAAKTSFSFPSPDLPEIAFAGRSNVGKSSLLNALTRQWGIVRTSDKPGLTQTINFFNLGPKLCLVDLPGYGFAYAKEAVKEAWQELVKEYVTTRSSLNRVCLLVDTKWGMKPKDSELIDLMEQSQTKYQIVLTKTDVVFPIDVARRAMEIEENLKKNKSALQPLMMVSSKTGAGIRSLRSVLANASRLVKR